MLFALRLSVFVEDEEIRSTENGGLWPLSPVPLTQGTQVTFLVGPWRTTRYTRFSPRESQGSGSEPGSGSGFLDNQNPKAGFVEPKHTHKARDTVLISLPGRLLGTSSFIAGLSPAPPEACIRNCPSPCVLDTVHLLPVGTSQGKTGLCCFSNKTWCTDSRPIPVSIFGEKVDTRFALLWSSTSFNVY